jgi:hypothetical protein
MMVTLEILKKHIGGVQKKLNFDTVLPFVKIAEREFSRVVGAQLFNHLNELTEGELREIAEGCICWAAYDMAMPHLKISVGDLGMAKQSPTNTVAITKWEYVDTREANMAMVDLFWEFFWEELEIVAPQVWTSSDTFKNRKLMFISSANELGRYVPLVGRNRRFFADLEKFITRAEDLYIADTTTIPVLENLKQKYRTGALLTGIEVSLIERIRYALAYLTLHEAYPYLPMLVDNEGLRQIRKKDGIREEDIAEKGWRQAQRRQLWQDSQLYLAQLRKFMDQYATIQTFPEYFIANMALPTDDEEDDYTHKPHVIL